MGNPPVAKGQRRGIEVCAVAWMDLLGYGSQISLVKYDPTAPAAVEAIKRLRIFHSILRDHARRHFISVVLNDGVIFYRDLAPRSTKPTQEFLRRCLDVFEAVNASELDAGLPGARMVVAAGFRVRGDIVERSFNTGVARHLFAKLKSKTITAEQAVHEALRARPYFDLVPEIQGNFALTKAYLADSAGSRAGFGGSKCFIDDALLDGTPPAWLILDEDIVKWDSHGISSKFRVFSRIEKQKYFKESSEGFATTFNVAAKISTSEKVIERLLASRRKNNART